MMNDSQNILLEKMIQLEKKFQDTETIITISQEQLLEISRELINSIIFQKAKDEAKSQ